MGAGAMLAALAEAGASDFRNGMAAESSHPAYLQGFLDARATRALDGGRPPPRGRTATVAWIAWEYIQATEVPVPQSELAAVQLPACLAGVLSGE